MYETARTQELYHWGVKGMKWGVRKKRDLPVSTTRSNYDSAKANMRSAKKAYDKSFNKAYYGPSAYSLSKKRRAISEQRWEDAGKKAEAYESARSKYKQAKKERKQQIKSTYQDLQKKATTGEKLWYSDGTRKKAAKYIVDNNMSMSEATKRAKSDANRNTVAFIAAYGATVAATLYAMNR